MHFRFNKALLTIYPLLLVPLLCASQVNAPPPTDTSAGQSREVEILGADYLKIQDDSANKMTRLVGNVALRQAQVLMWCDSANVYKESNSVDAFGRVHIRQDTVNAWSDFLNYDGTKKFAVLRGNAKLTDSKMVLYTDQLFYDSPNRLSYYLTGGRIIKDSTVITSTKSYYHHRESDAYFQGDVHIVDPNYELTSDTLKYNTETKISTFYGNTEIINKDSHILCDNGWYDSKKDLASFGKNTVVVDPPQRLLADSLYYERFRGFGRAFGPFQCIDSANETEIFGCYGEYYDKQQFIMSTDEPLLIFKQDKDSLFLTGDTLKSMHRSEKDTIRNFFAYHRVRMFMKSMQGVCDSLFYSFADSTFRMFYKPVVWNEDVQMSGDTIYLYTKGKKADRFSIYKNGFIISPSGKKYFDQIKGTNIFGFFKNDELHRMNVLGNAESLYFGKDDKEKFLGVNKVASTNITIYFKDKKIDKIAFLKKPDATFTPMKMVSKDMLTLKDFNWQIDRKPKSREELKPW